MMTAEFADALARGLADLLPAMDEVNAGLDRLLDGGDSE